MKKQCKRTFSFLVSIVLTIYAFSFNLGTSAAAVRRDDPLGEWIEMADALLAEGKTFSSGKEAFDSAYNRLYELRNLGVTDTDQINAAISELKTSWSELSHDIVYPIAIPKAENGTDITGEIDGLEDGEFAVCSNGSVIQVRFDAVSGAASLLEKADNIYFNIRGWQTENTEAEPNSNWTLINLNSDLYYGAGPNVKVANVTYTFSKDKLITTLNDTQFKSMLLKQGSYGAASTWVVGMLYATVKEYENVPVTYELFQWIQRAERLLANAKMQGKTYIEGLDVFNSALSAAKSATDESAVDTIISSIKAAWRGLKYETAAEVIALPMVENGTDISSKIDGIENGWLGIQSNGKRIQTRFDTVSGGNEKLAEADRIYFSIRGWQTVDTTKAPDTNWTIVNLNNSGDMYYGAGPNVAVSLKEYTFDKTKLLNTLNGAEFTSLLLKQGGYNSASVWVVSPLYAAKQGYEQLPSDRLLVWIERAEELLSDSSKSFTNGFDSFNAALDACRSADESSDAGALIANLKAAWNNLEYDEKIEIGYPSAEGVSVDDTFVPDESESEMFGSRYLKVADSKILKVRFDSSVLNYRNRAWFDDVKEIYFYVRGYLIDNAELQPESNWTGLNLNGTTYLSGGPNISVKLQKFNIATETLKKKMDENSVTEFRSILMQQGEYIQPSAWEVGTMYAVKSGKAHIADYGDVNDDGVINILDLVRAKKYFADTEQTVSEYALDMNDDNRLNADDLASVRKLLLSGKTYGDNTVSEDEVF